MSKSVNQERLLKRLTDRTARVGVVGMGYVGLPLALSFARVGFQVLGIDVDGEKIQNLKKGHLTFGRREPGLLALLARVRKTQRCEFSGDHRKLRSCEAVVVTVQTPLTLRAYHPDYRILISAITDVARSISSGSLLVVQSTLAPGTSKEIIWPLLERLSHQQVGEEIAYAYVPERVVPGRMIETLRYLPRIIGADDSFAAGAALLLYRPITKGDIDRTSIVTAELTKVAENSHRFMEINFVNALGLICEDYGASFTEVRRLANKRHNVHLLQPGAGIGGHCIPKDPWLLVWRHRQGFLAELFRRGDIINRFMARHVVSLLKQSLKQVGLNPKGARVAILGFSYREESDDTRQTPAVRVVRLLEKTGTDCTVHDPLVEEYRGNVKNVIRGKDALVVLTAHQEYRDLSLSSIRKLLRYPLIVDGRQTWDARQARKLGFRYYQIGDVPYDLADKTR